MSGTNPVSTYTLLNNATVSDAATYKSQIDSNSVVAARVVDQFAPHQYSTPTMGITLDAGGIYDGLALTEIAAQSYTTISNPAGANQRIDRVVVNNSTGVLSYLTGTPTTGVPAAPPFSAGQLPVARIGTLALPLTASTGQVTNNMITDERAFWGFPGIDAWVTYTAAATPAVGAFGSTTPTAAYRQQGKTIQGEYNLIIGSAGTAAGAISFPLPVSSAARYNVGIGKEYGVTGKAMTVFIGSGSTVGQIVFYDNGSTWANNHQIVVAYTYETV